MSFINFDSTLHYNHLDGSFDSQHVALFVGWLERLLVGRSAASRCNYAFRLSGRQSRCWIRSAVGLIRVSSYSRRAVGTSLGSSHGRDVFDSSGGRYVG